ncbi:PAAR repeat-containing protein [Caballeronia novacaledonica]|uniref:PAAR repeat-containing protein n=1 Tax=Caballeronia novacaledonica TaxID=1544861 RepID=A0A2U3I4V6_9BURK|nr:PAAR domain-containing protein [Caballeronia novacaledonica]SPB15136.1 PAAR repeat-containing protein [Caballeronia novacaledonica]
MTRQVIVVGDTLAPYGGQVIAGFVADTIDGRAIARVGDPVRCDAHGANAIAEGSPTFLCADRPVALSGHRALCGCTLVSLQTTLPVS